MLKMDSYRPHVTMIIIHWPLPGWMLVHFKVEIEVNLSVIQCPHCNIANYHAPVHGSALS